MEANGRPEYPKFDNPHATGLEDVGNRFGNRAQLDDVATNDASDDVTTPAPTKRRRGVTTGNTFRVLMWQHGLYYRRNKCSLAFTIIMPPIFAALLSLLIYAITSSAVRPASSCNTTVADPRLRQTVTCICYALTVEPAFALRSMVYFPNDTKTNEFAEIIMWHIYEQALPRDIAANGTNVYPVNCTNNPGYKFRGFRTRNEATDFTESAYGAVDNLTGNNNTNDPFFAPFFAVADLTRISENRFLLLNTSAASNEDLIEASYLIQAAISQRSGAQPVENISIGNLPNFDDEKVSSKVTSVANVIRAMVPSLMTAIIAVSGLSMSVDLIVQLVHEKESGFQAYLVSIGVSSMFVAVTWIVTGVGIAVITSIVEFIVLIMNSVLSTVNLAVLFFVVLLYNLSQLSIAMFIAALMKTRNHVVKLLLIILVLSIIASLVAVQSPETFAGSALAKKRAISLIPMVNIKITIDYLLQWKLNLYKDVTASHLACSPNEHDASSAIAECIAFLAFDIVLFLLLATIVTFGFPFLLEWKQRKKHRNTAAIHPQNSVVVGSAAESLPTQERGGIVMNRVSKHYGDTAAVSEVTATFPEGKITVLLGENGAGKSTSMDMIAGLQQPTSGHVLFDGEKLSKRKAEIQNQTSYLPQGDMFYPYLTLREHILLFGRVRGMSEKDILSVISNEATVFDLSSSLQVMGNRLSGGQKRKLGLMISYIVDPKYIILDEVTTGVDPYSARAIWSAILAKRGSSTTIISTHNMDEAEALADHVIVLSQGLNCASGSPGDLKDEHGQGFQIVVSSANMGEEQKGEIREQIQTHVANSEINTVAGDITFKVQNQLFQSQRMVDCLRSLEDVFSKYGQGSYGINEPNLQQVFFTVTQKHETPIHKRRDRNDRGIAEESGKNGSATLILMTQIGAVLYKRLLQSISSPITILFQLIVPIVLIVVCTASPTSTGKSFKYVTETTAKRCYREHILWFAVGDAETEFQSSITRAIVLHGVTSGQQPIAPSYTPGDYPSYKPADIPATRACIKSGAGKACDSDAYDKWRRMPFNTSADGSMFYDLKGDTEYLKVWLYGANQSFPTSVTFGLSFDQHFTVNVLAQQGYEIPVLNVLLSSNLQNSVASAKPILQYVEKATPPNMLTNLSSNAFTIAFLALAILYCLSDCQAAIAQDGDTGLKQFMFTTKLRPWVYWLTNLAYDLVLSSATVAILTAIVAATSDYPPGAFVTAGVVSALMIICYTYFANAITQNRQAASKLVQAGTNAIWVILLIYFPLLRLYHMMNGSNIDLEVFSTGVFGQMLTAIGIVVHFLRFVPAAVLSEMVVLLSLSITDISHGGIKASYFEKVFYGEIVGQAIAVSLLYFALLLLADEWNVFKRMCRSGCGRKLPIACRPLDPDVQTEESLVEGSSAAHSLPIAAVHLLKKFPRMPIPSVSNVTFGVRNKECFGLLGLNGAGKTTTFRMILGLDTPTAGNSYVRGTDVQIHPSRARQTLSYCAQNFTVCDYLTVEQHIKTFAAIQGKTENGFVEEILTSIGLEQYRSRKVGNLSGGNKKKVQFMCAVMASPKVLFLDEPTSGMDPGAQRQLWRLVRSQIAGGASVLLTSHNMFECENLCDRITVMVKGQLQCIGTIQYLKNKLGNRYTVRLRFEPPGKKQQVQGVFEEALDHKAVLVFHHSTGLAYEIDARELGRVSRIFEAVQRCREECGLETFSVSQLSLENVFVAMAERM